MHISAKSVSMNTCPVGDLFGGPRGNDGAPADTALGPSEKQKQRQKQKQLAFSWLDWHRHIALVLFRQWR
jgi:hypothetical protein